MKTLAERDQQYIWHPYTQMQTAAPAIPIVKGEGSYLYDEHGKRYLDAVSSWWVNLHGHAHPYITEKVAAQLNELEQVIFAGFTHPPAINLAEALLAILPPNQKKVFYTDNGSTAVEVALKMCLQFWTNKAKNRKTVLAFTNGYHGDTFGAMAVSGRSIWTKPFEQLLFDVVFIEPPTKQNLADLKFRVSELASETACFIYEPLVQGSGGMLMHSAECLDELMSHCRLSGVLMIQDEVFTGFGRTGKNFACDHLTEVPDLMCFSKGLTGGTMPLGVTTCVSEIFDAFLSNDQHLALYHGHSFTANPLACTAALASLDLLRMQETQEHIQRICKKHLEFSKIVRAFPVVKEVRQTGTILAIEWKSKAGTSYFNTFRDRLYPFFLEHGILLRPLGNVIYILPPYCMTDEDLDYIYEMILLAVHQFEMEDS